MIIERTKKGIKVKLSSIPNEEKLAELNTFGRFRVVSKERTDLDYLRKTGKVKKIIDKSLIVSTEERKIKGHYIDFECPIKQWFFV